jgi:hypothetical protein
LPPADGNVTAEVRAQPTGVKLGDSTSILCYDLRVNHDLRNWAATWQRAAVAMTEVERREALLIDSRVALEQLRPAFALARRSEPTTTTSGLVEMRRLLDKAHG